MEGYEETQMEEEEEGQKRPERGERARAAASERGDALGQIGKAETKGARH